MTDVEAICLSIFGTIQPDVLAELVRRDDGTKEADGFLQRFQLIVYPDASRIQSVDRPPDSNARARAYKIFQAIDRLDGKSLGAERGSDHDLPFLRFSAVAQSVFNEWVQDLNDKLSRGTETAIMEGHLAKYRSLMPSLALLFHLIDIADGARPSSVSEEATRRAAAWCDYLEAHARRIYRLPYGGSRPPIQDLARHLAHDLSNPFTVREVVRKKWTGLTMQNQVESVLRVLEDHHWVLSQPVPSGPKGGHSTRHYWIHPEVLADREDHA